MMIRSFALLLLIASSATFAHERNTFDDLGHLLRAPTAERSASGAPGPQYWQQTVNYEIKADLDDINQRLYGRESIEYINNSPHKIQYIWLQLHQNRFDPQSKGTLSQTSILDGSDSSISYASYQRFLAQQEFDGGFKVTRVSDELNNELSFKIVGTLLRLELPEALAPGSATSFKVDWWYNIVDSSKIRARSGYEFFEKDGNYIYEIAQWFPRVVAFTDYDGWQNKEFLGSAEFTLEFGDYLVSLTVPADFVVAATGELENADRVLTGDQRSRFRNAIRSDDPIYVVTPNEAIRNQKSKSKRKKTWIFRALGVRDFAFAASRKFIWDAQAVEVGDTYVTAMSFYPPEGIGLWDKYSTKAVAHTLKVYSKHTFDYPYPVAISVNGPVGGMEYPMITFNAPRPYDDGTYWDLSQKGVDRSWHHSKYGLISVIIHEIGHIYFPMIVNSDEAKWTWMDEGINTFLQFIAEREWERDYPSQRGFGDSVAKYMKGGNSVPIMTVGDAIIQRGSNAYGKPASALNVLRELVMGRENFDYAFATYSKNWKFKRPTPTDFFRTMEDASGIDLDWFWWSWFYTTDYVDIELKSIKQWRVDTLNPDTEAAFDKSVDDALPPYITQVRNDEKIRELDRDQSLSDFYNENPDYISQSDRDDALSSLEKLETHERALHSTEALLYELEFINHGGIPSPLPLKITFEDQSFEERMIPVEVWRYSPDAVKVLVKVDKPVTGVVFDENRASGDADISNNAIPRLIPVETFKLEKSSQPDNPLRKSKK